MPPGAAQPWMGRKGVTVKDGSAQGDQSPWEEDTFTQPRDQASGVGGGAGQRTVVLRLRFLDSKTEWHSLPRSCLGTGGRGGSTAEPPSSEPAEGGASSHPQAAPEALCTLGLHPHQF